ncbi:MAG: hypothetical protein WBC26_06730 [Alphaproteobacteria bacterium]
MKHNDHGDHDEGRAFLSFRLDARLSGDARRGGAGGLAMMGGL